MYLWQVSYLHFRYGLHLFNNFILVSENYLILCVCSYYSTLTHSPMWFCAYNNLSYTKSTLTPDTGLFIGNNLFLNQRYWWYSKEIKCEDFKQMQRDSRDLDKRRIYCQFKVETKMLTKPFYVL